MIKSKQFQMNSDFLQNQNKRKSSENIHLLCLCWACRKTHFLCKKEPQHYTYIWKCDVKPMCDPRFMRYGRCVHKHQSESVISKLMMMKTAVNNKSRSKNDRHVCMCVCEQMRNAKEFTRHSEKLFNWDRSKSLKW